MQFQVPQNVQREDTILWFITLKQFLILLVGVGISYYMFLSLNKTYNLNQVEAIFSWIPFGIAIIIAFVKVYGIPFYQWVLLVIESSFFRPPRRYWIQGKGEPFVSYTTPFTEQETSTSGKGNMSSVPNQKIKDIAIMLDNKN